jgi:hypothetical protein
MAAARLELLVPELAATLAKAKVGWRCRRRAVT